MFRALVRTRTVLSATTMIAALVLPGCRSDLSLALERRRPALVALPEARRLGVLELSGPDGARVAAAVRARVDDDGAFLRPDQTRLEAALGRAPLRADGGAGGRSPPRSDVADLDDAIVARIARDGGVDAVLVGRVLALEVGRVLEQKTTVTKRGPDGALREVDARRRIRTGRIRVELRAVLADGRVVRGRPVVKDYRAECVDDPAPALTTVAPPALPNDAIPDEAQVKDVLLAAAAKDVAEQVIPRRELVAVVWEDANGHDAEARERILRREIDEAARLLRELLASRRPFEPEVLAALSYDLGVCEDLLGDLERAERHLDEALSVRNSERHQAVLRDVRRRHDELRREGAP